ncbi:SDR family NAD(P)-dependent oxidoreductase [Hyphomonas sp.]|uniref:SDR family NAD(P)-dependent oxidoreductase n=1 Tax=Hyphomonas sp. TaxID=87 RepID=UPI00391D8FEF
MSMKRRVCLITGASAGIGAEFARQYAALGWDLVLTARREDRLQQLASEVNSKHRIEAHVIACDLADPSAPAQLVAELESRGIEVDALVNNAGYGLPGTFFSTRWEEQEAFLQVLLKAPVELTHRLLPGMAARSFGRIINVASLAGYTAGSAGHTLYGPVKAALIKFSESIAAECKALGHQDIRCTALCPGFTWSEFHDVNGTREATKQMPKWMWMQAEPVVAAGIAAVNRGQPVIVPGGVNKLIATLARVLPEPAGRALVSAQSARYRKL